MLRGSKERKRTPSHLRKRTPKRNPETGLNPRQERFARAYIAQGFENAAKAAIEAGYSYKSANATGSILLDHPKVNEFIQTEKKRLFKRYDVTADRVIGEMARLGFSNMSDYIRTTPDGGATVDLSNLTRDQAAAIQEITSEVYVEGFAEDEDGERQPINVKRTKLKLADKKGPLVELGKYVGVFKESSVPPSVQISIVYTEGRKEVAEQSVKFLEGQQAS